MRQVWSCGGGVQSAAIAALIVQGRLPKPDYSLIVDTEREKETTWTYYDEVLKPKLAAVGVDLIRIPKSRYATVDLWHDDDILIPAYTNKNGLGKLSGYCSNEWKRRVIMRYLREHRVERCQNWVGISLDEMNRVRVSDKRWFQHRYPLIFEVPLRRGGCVELVKQMGWPPAPRSSCWMCPHHDDAEWQSMTEADMRQAQLFEREIQQLDPHLFLHQQCVPLEEVKFGLNTNDGGCQTGFCFT